MSNGENRLLLRALAALGESLRDEALAFEARAYGQPFLPKELAESKRLFGEHCRRIDSYFGFRNLHHVCWMSTSSAAAGREVFLLEFDKGVAKCESSRSGSEIRLLSKTAMLLSKGMLWGLSDLAVTPRLFIPGDAMVIPYVVFRNEVVAQLLCDGRVDYGALRTRFEHSDSLREFIYADTVIVDQKNATAALTSLSEFVNPRRRFFEAYHVILGFAKVEIAELRKNSFANEVLRLLSMQFHREWGNREQEMQAHREAQEARLQKVSDLLSAFDDMLHSGLNTLRAMKSGLACQDFADGVPPKRLRYRLVPARSRRGAGCGEFDERMEKVLLETLARCWRSEQATAAAMSLGRILANRKILAGMRSDHDSDLSIPVIQAEALLGYYASDIDREYRVFYDISQLKQGILPMGYLSGDLLAVFIYELLLNAFRHARVPVETEVQARGDGNRLILTVSSPVQPGIDWVMEGGIALPSRASTSERRKSFLIRFREIEQILEEGLAIKTRVQREEQGDMYQVDLILSTLSSEEGTFVSPVWRET